MKGTELLPQVKCRSPWPNAVDVKTQAKLTHFFSIPADESNSWKSRENMTP